MKRALSLSAAGLLVAVSMAMPVFAKTANAHHAHTKHSKLHLQGNLIHKTKHSKKK